MSWNLRVVTQCAPVNAAGVLIYVAAFALGGSVQAAEPVSRTPERFDVVITDQAMPNLRGVQLAKEIHGIRPDTPIVLSTGFSDVLDRKRAEAVGIRSYLMKPFRDSDLAAAIRAALETREKAILLD